MCNATYHVCKIGQWKWKRCYLSRNLIIHYELGNPHYCYVVAIEVTPQVKRIVFLVLVLSVRSYKRNVWEQITLTAQRAHQHSICLICF